MESDFIFQNVAEEKNISCVFVLPSYCNDQIDGFPSITFKESISPLIGRGGFRIFNFSVMNGLH